MSSLVTRLGAALVARGVEIHLARRSSAGTGPGHAGWVLAQVRRELDADGVVLAVPAPAAGRLLEPHDGEAAGLLGHIAYASVALITFRVPLDALASPLVGTGFLVPRRSAGRRDDQWAVTACTYLSQKWPALARPGDHLLRASVGRYGDDRAEAWSDAVLVERAWDELGALLGVSGEPMESMVARWPAAFPQYRVHHLLRTTGIEAAAARLGGVAVAGSAYRGVGIPACIASGRAAAQVVT